MDSNNSAVLESFLSDLRLEIQEQLQADADQAIGELKSILVEEQAAITAISTQVRSLIETKLYANHWYTMT